MWPKIWLRQRPRGNLAGRAGRVAPAEGQPVNALLRAVLLLNAVILVVHGYDVVSKHPFLGVGLVTSAFALLYARERHLRP